MPFLPQEGATHVALDTNILWDLRGDRPEPDWFPSWRTMADHSVRFSISDFALLEFVNQFLRGDFCDSAFTGAMDRARKVVWPDLPLLPPVPRLKRLLEESEANSAKATEERANIIGLWRKVSESTSISELRTPQRYQILGLPVFVDPTLHEPQEVLARLRSIWTRIFDSYDEATESELRSKANLGQPECTPRALEARRALAEAHTQAILASDGWSLSHPFNKRFELVIEYLLDRSIASARRKSPYNPHANRNQNDGLDFLMLHALMIPAFIVTRDQEPKKRLRNLSRPEAEMLLTPAELVERWNQGTLAPSLSPGSA